jgi:hypothetical protein
MYVLHMDSKNVEDVINGTLYEIPPDEPFEIENKDHGRLLLEHKYYTGIVEVEVRKDKGNITVCVDEAREKALANLAAQDAAMFNRWVEDQYVDRIRKNFPALPAVGRVKEIIERRRINIAEYGIRPVEVGFGKGADNPVPSATSPDVLALQAQNDKLQKQLELQESSYKSDIQQMQGQVSGMMQLLKDAGLLADDGDESDNEDGEGVDANADRDAEGADAEGTRVVPETVPATPAAPATTRRSRR